MAILPRPEMPTQSQIDLAAELYQQEYPYDEHIESYVVSRQGEWLVSVTPMIFNDRIVLTHEREYPHTCSAGFCYDKGGAAFLAARVWDVATQREPAGYKKKAFDAREETNG